MGRRIRGLFERLLGSRQMESAAEVATDSELLRRFALVGDQEAFELLIWRHGAMVLGVCQRQIQDEHLSEDAFQAVFLVLAKKARAIRGGNVAGWLYRVARRVAARVAQRRVQLAELSDIAVEETVPFIERKELSELLDGEIARLPQRLRQPVLLCYLGGRSAEEAAQELGCPRGTILSRLSLARKRLAERLGRRGIALPSAVPLVAFEMRGRLVSATVAEAARFVAGRSQLDSVSILAQGMIRNMLHTKLMATVGVMVMATVLIGGVGWVTAQGDSGDRVHKNPASQTESKPELRTSKLGAKDLDQPKKEYVSTQEPIPEFKESDDLLDSLKLDPIILNALKSDPNDTPIQKLQRDLCRELAIYQGKIMTLVNIGKWNPTDFPEAIQNAVSLSRNLVDIMEKPIDKLKCYALGVRLLKEIEQFTDTRVLVGSDPSQNHNYVKAARLEAEIKLLKFKTESEKLGK